MSSFGIDIKRAYDPAGDDGYRVLVDRLWPRGIKKVDLALDEWCRDIAPSTELRKWFNHEAIKVTEFRKRYEAELDTTEMPRELLDRALGSGKQKMTLLYSAKTAELSQAMVIQEYLLKIL